MSGSSSALSPQSFSPSQNESANTQTFVYGQLTMSNTQRIGAAHAVQQRTTAIRSAMIESWFNVQLDTKQVASQTFPQAKLSIGLVCMEKTKPNTAKARIHQSKEM